MLDVCCVRTHQLYTILVDVCVEVNLCCCLAGTSSCVAFAAPGCAISSHLHADPVDNSADHLVYVTSELKP